MTLSDIDTAQPWETFRAGGGAVLVRGAVRLVLQELIEAEATEAVGAGRYERGDAREQSQAAGRAGCARLGGWPRCGRPFRLAPNATVAQRQQPVSGRAGALTPALGRAGALLLLLVPATERHAPPLARLHLACGRMVGGARAIAEAYGFGVSEGPHPEPWTAAYHRAAVHVYAESLPVAYERRIESLFIHSAEAMAAVDIPSELAEDWLIVKTYLHNASSAIADWLAAERRRSPEDRRLPSPEIGGDQPPRVIHYDRLAALTTLEGARRLERAAIAVQRRVGAPSAAMLDDGQRRLLDRLAGGAAIVDMAADLGYSERTIYRALDRLYENLGVGDRLQAVRKAAAEGLLDG